MIWKSLILATLLALIVSVVVAVNRLSEDQNIIGQVHLLRDRQMTIGDTPAKWGRLVANKVVVIVPEVFVDYAERVDLNIIFFAGHPNERVGVAEKEMIPWWMFPFFVVGLLFMIKRKTSPVAKTLCLIWIWGLIGVPHLVLATYWILVFVGIYFLGVYTYELKK